MTTDDFARFQSGADKYAAYLETSEGRLRLDLAFANLQEFLPRHPGPLQVLDLGGGTGANAVRLAKLGLHVTLVDESLPMLALAERAAREARVAEMVTLIQGSVDNLTKLLDFPSFNVVLCHNLLEYVDDPSAVLRSAAHTLCRPSGIISIVVRSQAGEVLKSAIKDGALTAAKRNLSAEWGCESLYGGRARLFSRERLQNLLRDVSLAIIAERGIRVVSDYLPPQISREKEYKRIFELERMLGKRPEFVGIARYTHCLAYLAGPALKGGG
jgi:S-adenosylmethionine-dependent methyltransferase